MHDNRVMDSKYEESQAGSESDIEELRNELYEIESKAVKKITCGDVWAVMKTLKVSEK